MARQRVGLSSACFANREIRVRILLPAILRLAFATANDCTCLTPIISANFKPRLRSTVLLAPHCGR